MRKILFVIGSTFGGGAEKRAIFISNLVKDRFQSRVFAFYGSMIPGIDNVYEEEVEQYKAHSLFEKVKALRTYIDDFNPDVVVSFLPHVNLLTTFALRRRKFKNIKHIVAIAFHKYKLKNKLFLSCSINRAASTYYQCEAQKRFIHTKRDSFVLYNPISYKENIDRDTKSRFMSAGRLDDQKDYVLQINAFKEISKVIPNATLDIYGSGSQKNTLIELIEKLELKSLVSLHEYTTNIEEAYAKHDVFLFTTKYEGFPNALAEALGHGLICFSTYFETGCDELLKNNENGYICYTRSPSDFANLVIEKLKNYGEAQEAAKKGILRIKEVCDTTSFVDKFEIEINRILNK